MVWQHLCANWHSNRVFQPQTKSSTPCQVWNIIALPDAVVSIETRGTGRIRSHMSAQMLERSWTATGAAPLLVISIREWQRPARTGVPWPNRSTR